MLIYNLNAKSEATLKKRRAQMNIYFIYMFEMKY